MSELNKVVAAILRDISEARSMADFYSRDMAQIYSGDNILKFFPIPRIDIKELNIDLKFAVGTVEVDETRTKFKDIKIKSLYDKYSELLTEEIQGGLKSLASKDAIYEDAFNQLKASGEKTFVKEAFKKELETYFETAPEKRITLETIKDHFNEKFYSRIESPYRYRGFDVFASPKNNGTFSIRLNTDDNKSVITIDQTFESREAAYEVINIITSKSKTHMEERTEGSDKFLFVKNDEGKIIISKARIHFELSDKELSDLKIPKGELTITGLTRKYSSSPQTPRSILKTKFAVDNPLHKTIDGAVVNTIEKIKKETDEISKTENELKVQILITADELKSIPENSISSIRLSTELKNYVVAKDASNDSNTLIQQ